MSTKQCSRCGLDKPATKEFFVPYRPRGTGKHPWDVPSPFVNPCRTCKIETQRIAYATKPERREKVIASSKAYAKSNRAKIKEQHRAAALRREFGLEVDVYGAMVISQKGCCAICERPPMDGKSLRVDHDHQTGQIRRLLCGRCNLGLGHFADDPFLLTKAAQYVLSHRVPQETARVVPITGRRRRRC